MATARGGMLIADLLPALEEKVQSLRSDLEAARYLSELQYQVTLDLQAGLVALQETRAALGRAIADRDDLPKRFVEDPAQTAILLAAADTLDIFADGLSLIAKMKQREPTRYHHAKARCRCQCRVKSFAILMRQMPQG